MTPCMQSYLPGKVTSAGGGGLGWGGGQAYDMGLPDHTGGFNNSNSFQHNSDITNGKHIHILICPHGINYKQM